MATTMVAADLAYDPETHTSVDLDGCDVPHVTRVLSAVGVSTDFEEVGLRSRRLAQRIDYRRQLGSAVHADCHAYDDDDLEWPTVDAEVRPFLEAWITCRDALGLLALAHARERQVYHPMFRYTGILDGIFRLPAQGRRKARHVLVDLKIGDPNDAAAHLQTAAYERAYIAEQPRFRIDERWAVQLVPGAIPPYRVTNYSARQSAHSDFGTFLACLCVYNHQPARRPRDF